MLPTREHPVKRPHARTPARPHARTPARTNAVLAHYASFSPLLTHRLSQSIEYCETAHYSGVPPSILRPPRRPSPFLPHRYDVFKVETIGDAYMAVTNLHKDQCTDHARRIACFARAAVAAANSTLIDLGLASLTLTNSLANPPPWTSLLHFRWLPLTSFAAPTEGNPCSSLVLFHCLSSPL